jgi:hypothetical protein
MFSYDCSDILRVRFIIYFCIAGNNTNRNYSAILATLQIPRTYTVEILLKLFAGS